MPDVYEDVEPGTFQLLCEPLQSFAQLYGSLRKSHHVFWHSQKKPLA